MLSTTPPAENARATARGASLLASCAALFPVRGDFASVSKMFATAFRA